jgi:molecular chaperone DnaK
MSYVLGVDLGTTFTAAAVHREGRTETAQLADRAPVIPSVLFVGDPNVTAGPQIVIAAIRVR